MAPMPRPHCAPHHSASRLASIVFWCSELREAFFFCARSKVNVVETCFHRVTSLCRLPVFVETRRHASLLHGIWSCHWSCSTLPMLASSGMSTGVVGCARLCPAVNFSAFMQPGRDANVSCVCPLVVSSPLPVSCLSLRVGARLIASFVCVDF